MSDNIDPPASTSGLVLYRTEDEQMRIEVRLEGDTVWLTQAQMAELFQTSVPNINLHLKAIFDERELVEAATIKDYLIVRQEGSRQVSRNVLHYRLEAILAVGFRVRSTRGTQFRQWATARLSEYLVKGFTMDDERLKNPPGAGAPDYFDEMLARVRDIRTSERRVYLRVREILALAADYQPADAETQLFFQTIQNKLHFAATGQTAPELIAERVDHYKPHAGLTSFSGERVRKHDVTVAKNYLSENEIDELNRIVVMFLDYADDQARRRKQVFMRDWREKLDEFLRFNERAVLDHAGRVTREQADRLAHEQYDLFQIRQREAAELAGEDAMLKAVESTLIERKGKPNGKPVTRRGKQGKTKS